MLAFGVRAVVAQCRGVGGNGSSSGGVRGRAIPLGDALMVRTSALFVFRFRVGPVTAFRGDSSRGRLTGETSWAPEDQRANGENRDYSATEPHKSPLRRGQPGTSRADLRP